MNEAELQRLIIRIIGDASSYSRMLQVAEQDTLRTAQKLKALAIATSAVGASIGLVGVALKRFGQLEQLEIAFGTIIQDGKLANKTLNDLIEFARHTPFEITEVVKGGRQLLAYGFSAEQVVEQLKLVGDVAAGMGQDLNELTYVYGTLKAQNRAFKRDLNQFALRGIPIYRFLAEELDLLRMGTDGYTEAVNEMAEQGTLKFAVFEKAFRRMTSKGGMFFEATERQSKSLLGLVAKLADTITIFSMKFGEAIAEEFGIKTAIRGITEALENIDYYISRIHPGLRSFLLILIRVSAVTTALAIAWKLLSLIIVLMFNSLAKNPIALALSIAVLAISSFIQVVGGFENAWKIVLQVVEIVRREFNRIKEEFIANIQRMMESGGNFIKILTAISIIISVVVGAIVLFKVSLGLLIFVLKYTGLLFLIKTGFLLAYKIVINAYTIAVNLATIAQWAWNVALAAMMTILAPIPATVAALIIVAYGLYVTLFSIAAVAIGLWATWKALYNIVDVLFQLDYTVGPLMEILQLFKEWWRIINAVVNGMSKDIPKAMELLRAGMKLAWIQIKNLWPPLWNFIKEGFKVLWRLVVETFRAEFSRLEPFSDIIALSWAAGWESSIFGLSSGFNDLGNNIELTISKIEQFFAILSLTNPHAKQVYETIRGIRQNYKELDKQIELSHKLEVERARRALQNLMKNFKVDRGEWFGIPGLSAEGAARAEVERLMKELDAMQPKIENNNDAVDENGKKWEQVGDQINKAANNLNKFDAALFGSAEALFRIHEYKEALFGSDRAIKRKDPFVTNNPGSAVAGVAGVVAMAIKEITEEQRKAGQNARMGLAGGAGVAGWKEQYAKMSGYGTVGQLGTAAITGGISGAIASTLVKSMPVQLFDAFLLSAVRYMDKEYDELAGVEGAIRENARTTGLYAAVGGVSGAMRPVNAVSTQEAENLLREIAGSTKVMASRAPIILAPANLE